MMMNEQELKRNGSGYIDEPCFKAVTAPPRPGEVWIHAKSGAQMLVLANVNGICSTLKLTDISGEGTIPVTSKTQMHTKPIMIGYCFDNLLTTFVKSVKDEEMKTVRKGIVRALGLGLAALEDDSPAKEKEALGGALEAQRAENMYLRVENESLKKQLAEAKKEAEFSKNDLDAKNMADKMVSDSIEAMDQEITRLSIYKDMYMDIIGKLVSMRGGAAVNE